MTRSPTDLGGSTLRIVVVAAASGLALGSLVLLALELAWPRPVRPAADVLGAVVDAAPSGESREALLASIRASLMEAAVSPDPDQREAAALLMDEVISGALVLDVEAGLAREALAEAERRAPTDPVGAGERLSAMLQRGWLPPDVRRLASRALWSLIDSQLYAVTPERGFSWLVALLEWGVPGEARRSVLDEEIARVVGAGMLPGPDGLPTMGHKLTRLRSSLAKVLRPDEGRLAFIDRLAALGAWSGPPEVLLMRLLELADDGGTPIAYRDALRSGALVLRATTALRGGDVEGALAIAEPLARTRAGDPGIASLLSTLHQRLGDPSAALEALRPYMGPAGRDAPELRRRAARMLRQRGRIDEARALLPEGVHGRMLRMVTARREAIAALRVGRAHQADRRNADARSLADTVDWAIESALLELAEGDLRPSRSGPHVREASALSELVIESTRQADLTPRRLCALALVADRAGQRARALRLLARGESAETAEELDVVGLCFRRLGLQDRARATFDRAFDLASTRDQRARIAFHRFTAAAGLEDALAWGRKADSLGIRGAATPMLEAQAQLYSRRGQLGDACQLLDIVVESTPVDRSDPVSLVDAASYLRSRYDCRGDVADLERASELLRVASALDDDPVVLANHADVLAHLGIVQVLEGTVRTATLKLSSSRPDFLELATMGRPRKEVLDAARRRPELVEAVALYELLVRRAPGESDAASWLARWYEVQGDDAALERLFDDLPPLEDTSVAPCAEDPECVQTLRDAWVRARRIMDGASAADPRTQALAAILLSAAARDLAPVAQGDEQPLAIAEERLRKVLARAHLPDVALVLAGVLVAEVEQTQRAQSPDEPLDRLLLPEVDRLRARRTGTDDPHVTEAGDLIRGAEAEGALPGRQEAWIVALSNPEEGAAMLTRWAKRPGVLAARQIAYTLSPADPAAVLGLADAIRARGSEGTAEDLLRDARERGVPVPDTLVGTTPPE